MRTVKIYFNPYINSTRLIVDGNEYACKGRRIDEFIIGQPMNNWLDPYVCSYHRWDGLLAELMDELNDDELAIYFYSLPAYFRKLTDQLQSQAEYLEGRGYSSRRWECECVEYYLPEKMKSRILNFIQAKKHFVPDQFSMNLFDYCEQELMQQAEVSVDLLKEIYRNLSKAVNTAAEFYGQKKSNPKSIKVWNNAKRELLKLFGGTGWEE